MKHHPLYTSLLWVPINSEADLPAESKDYFIINKSGSSIAILPYSAKHKAFNAHDTDDNADYTIEVSYWAEIPGTLQALCDKLWEEENNHDKLSQERDTIKWS